MIIEGKLWVKKMRIRLVLPVPRKTVAAKLPLGKNDPIKQQIYFDAKRLSLLVLLRMTASPYLAGETR